MMDSAAPAQVEAPPAEPALAARAVGLRHVSDASPGIRRRRSGKGFRYLTPDGTPLRDPDALARIRALAIPPAWKDVWICPSASGHIQATGRDERGRKQYRYHPRWRLVRDETKYHRMLAFGEALPRIRARALCDMERASLTREKVLGTVVRLLEATLIRVGNEEYARTNSSFGLTTMRDEHVAFSGKALRFRFRGKSGVAHAITLSDRRLASVVRQCRDVPGCELFQYLDEAGEPRPVHSGDVNDYLREISGEEFTAKDFRTWAGTVLAARALAELGPPASAREAKKRIVAAVERVAERLGNTTSVCRKCYVHPAVLEAYAEGIVVPLSPRERARAIEEALAPERPKLTEAEEAVLALLRRRLGAAEVLPLRPKKRRAPQPRLRKSA